MCGIAGIIGIGCRRETLAAMVRSQKHRGPDGEGSFFDPELGVALGHSRLSIIDLSAGGDQPMASADGRHVAVINGEIYNYLELRRELEGGYTFRTKSDTEVVVAAYQKWGPGCLDHLIGMFALIIWDTRNKTAFAARDRFGVKPLYYHLGADSTLYLASEIKALHAAGVPAIANEESWANYLSYGLSDHSNETFWKGILSLPPGGTVSYEQGSARFANWYDVAARIGDDDDSRPEDIVREEYFGLMKDSVRLRFRSDVPVGINLSGGLDSSSLLGLVHEVQGMDSDVKAFTFVTGDSEYDELPWVEKMLDKTRHPLIVSELQPGDVPSLAESVQRHADEPFGGLPTLAYARLFEMAREHGVTVLLDGNGMDEQWAGYDYYESSTNRPVSMVQGVSGSPVRPECLSPEFRALANPLRTAAAFSDRVRNLQYRDLRFTKIPRAMRFNDRVSMRSSTELREPFLDHRMVELAMRQPPERKIQNGIRKKMLREIAQTYLPRSVSQAPKRPLQTPQREWLRGPLREWAESRIEGAISGPQGSYLDKSLVRKEAAAFFGGSFDNSFFVWQWISMGLMKDL